MNPLKTHTTSLRWSVAVIIAMAVILRPGSALSGDTASGSSVAISLDGDGLPANDLLDPRSSTGRILDPQEAWALKTTSHVDLSRLDPDTSSDVWGRAEEKPLPIQSGDSVGFLGVISSSSGRLRFNVRSGTQTLTLLISKNLHPLLLRQALLSRLGYRIPEIKFLPRFKVRFPTPAARDFFLKSQIPTATLGADTRWTEKPDSSQDPLEVTFHDAVAMAATPDYYNLALGPPIELIAGTSQVRALGPRVLRALAIAYGLLDIPESVNQLSWSLGRVESGSVSFTVPDSANFGCTLDDALWMLRRLQALTRHDLAAVIAEGRYPEPVAQLILEKIISRRNTLLSVFGVPGNALSFDPKLAKITQSDWPGYASRFAYGDPQSPLQGLKYYFLSQAQSNASENLLSWANRKLPSLTAQQGALDHQSSLVEKAMNQFLRTGEVQKVGFGAWVAPIASGGVNVSRDVVIGHYLGTNNLLQLADTFGITANAGLMVGFDGMPTATQLRAMIQGSVSISMTHLKPLSGLKQAITEPIQRELVPLLALRAAELFSDISSHPEADKKSLVEQLDRLREILGVGESLILTESVNGTQSVSASVQAPVAISPALTAQAGLNEVILARIHFFRKDASTLLVFKDRGELVGANLSLLFTTGMAAQFPIFSLNAKSVVGSAKSMIFDLDLTPDPAVNPSIYGYSAALASALRTGSTEVLESVRKPTLLDVGFRDRSSSFSFLHFVHRTLRTNGSVHVQLPDGTSGDFISLTDGSQSGRHYQQLATQAATYMVQRLTGNNLLNVDTQAAVNPGQSFLGKSQTRNTEFQGSIESKQLLNPFVRIQYRWQGWEISTPDARKIVDDLNARYGFQLYPERVLADAQSVKLYEISLSLSLYEGGVRKILGMTVAEQKALTQKISRKNRCDLYPGSIGELSGEQISSCAAIEKFSDALGEYRRGNADPAKKADQAFRAVAQLERFVEFSELVRLAGGAQNLFVQSMITGFRVGSETLSEPVVSSTFGQPDRVHPSGVLDSVQRILGIGDGEFDMQWIRDVL